MGLLTVPCGIVKSAQVGGFTPADISTSLWFDCSDTTTLFNATSGGSLPANNATVARINDKSGNGRNAIQSASGSRPLRLASGLNGLGTLSFDGTDDLLNISTTVATLFNTTYKLYVVFKGTADRNIDGQAFSNDAIIGDTGGFWSTGVLSNNNAFVGNFGPSNFRIATAYTQNTWAIVQSQSISGSYGLSVNRGTMVTAVRGAPGTTTGTLQIFRNYNANTYCLQGELAELIATTTDVSLDNENKIYTYLTSKWGITI